MIANGTIKTVEQGNDIYISLTSLCDYFVASATQMSQELEIAPVEQIKYASGIRDLMFTIAQEFCELGKFEAQRRLIQTPADLLSIIDKNKNN